MKLNDFYSHMASLQARWPCFFANYNFVRKNNEITWNKRAEREDFEKTPDLLARLIEKRQYSMQVAEDGSIIQLYYSFLPDGATVNEASLSFIFAGEHQNYENSDDDMENIDDDGSQEDGVICPIESSMEGIFPLSGQSWMRLDFHPKDASDCLHYHSHLHLCISSEIRIPVKKILTPKQFIELIIAWFYPSTYRSTKLQNGKFQLEPSEIKSLFGDILQVVDDIPILGGIHISVP